MLSSLGLHNTGSSSLPAKHSYQLLARYVFPFASLTKPIVDTTPTTLHSSTHLGEPSCQWLNAQYYTQAEREVLKYQSNRHKASHINTRLLKPMIRTNHARPINKLCWGIPRGLYLVNWLRWVRRYLRVLTIFTIVNSKILSAPKTVHLQLCKSFLLNIKICVSLFFIIYKLVLLFI